MKHPAIISTERFLSIAFIICVAGSLLIYRQIDSQHVKSNLVTHSYILKVTLNEFLITLTEAETNQRGYLLTKDSDFLINYQGAIQKSRALLTILDSLTTDNPVQQDYLAKLRANLNNSRLALQASVMISDPGLSGDDVIPVILEDTRGRLDNLRATVYDMIREENRLLERRIEDRNGIMRMNPYISFVAFLFVMLLIVFVYLKLKKETVLRIGLETNSAELELKDQQQAKELFRLNELLVTQNSIFLQAEKIAMIGSYTWNLSSGEMHFSDNLFRLLGYEPQEFKPSVEEIFRLIHPSDKKDALSNRPVFLESMFRSEMPYRFITKEGVIKYFKLTGKRIYKPDFEILVGTFQDITKEIELRQNLKSKTEALLQVKYEKQSAEKFKALADSMPPIVWTADPNGHIDYFNQRWYNYIRTNTGHLSSDRLEDNIHPEDLAKYFDCWRQSLSTGQALQVEFRFKDHKNPGEFCWFLAKALAIHDQRGEIIKWHGTFTDINDLKLAELSIQKLARQKEDFLSIASHELKTPVTSLKGSIQLLDRIAEEEQLTGDLTTLIALSGRQVNKLARMVQDLLDVSKLDANKIELVKSSFILEEALKDSIEQVRLLSKRHIVRMKGPANWVVNANIERIEQVVTNILSNAIKYSPAESEIWIETSLDTDHVRVAVTDKGIGIPPEKIPFVFDRFFRVEETSDRFSGLGLGLYISSEIIARHGGKMGVISEQGKGSTFWFTLPVNIE